MRPGSPPNSSIRPDSPGNFKTLQPLRQKGRPPHLELESPANASNGFNVDDMTENLLLSSNGSATASIDVVEVSQSCREISGLLCQETKVSGLDSCLTKAAAIPWARFTILWILCGIASGMLPGQALWVKLFADAGIFRAACDGQKVGDTAALSDGESFNMGTCTQQFIALTRVFQTCQCISVVFLAPIGLFYDRFGARVVGVAGAFLCALGLFLVWLSLLGAATSQELGTSILFFLAVLICDFGAMLNSFSFMGLIWHFPARQALVLSLINGTYQVSSFLPLMIEVVMQKWSTPLSWIMFAYFLLVTSIIYFFWRLIPTQTEFYRMAKRALGLPLPQPPKEFRVRVMLIKALEVLRRDPMDHIVSGVAIAIGYSFPGFYASLTAPYGEELFGHRDDGDRLAQTYVGLNGLVGLFVGPFIGALADRFGMQAFLYFLGGILAVATITCGFQSWAAQTICSLMLVLWSALFQLFIYKYLLHYAPPNRFGAVQGVYSMLLMCVSLPITFSSLELVAMLPDGPDAYRIPMYCLGSASSVAAFGYALYYSLHPPPEVPSLLLEDEAELARNFGCGTLDEVMEVVRIQKKEQLVKMLSSSDPVIMHQLLRSIDTLKMMDMMMDRSVDELAAMMEAGVAEAIDLEDFEEPFHQPSSDRSPRNFSTKYSPLFNDDAPPQVPISNRIQPLLFATSVDTSRAQAIAMRTPLGRLMNLCSCGVLGGSQQRTTKQADDHEEDEETRQARLAEKMRIQALGDFLVQMVQEADRACVTNYLLKESVEDMWLVTEDLEQRQTEMEQKMFNANFEKIVPAKEFAVLLRQRPGLRTFVQRLIKRNVDRKIGSSLRRT